MTVLEVEVLFSFLSTLLAEVSVSELRTRSHLPVRDQEKVVFHLLGLSKDKDHRNTEWIRLEGTTGGDLAQSPYSSRLFLEDIAQD